VTPQQPAQQSERVAARPEPEPAASATPTRTSVTGNWTAKEAAGRSCRVTLSGTPTLDLYKASSSGCQSKELQRVTAWELRGDEVYLYEPGGGIAARLKKSGNNFDGTAAKTGAPVTLSK
jgi:Protease inhibitor Inh